MLAAICIFGGCSTLRPIHIVMRRYLHVHANGGHETQRFTYVVVRGLHRAQLIWYVGVPYISRRGRLFTPSTPPQSNHMVPGRLNGVVSSSSIPLHKTTYSACWLTRSGYQGMLLCCQKAIRDLITTENATYPQEMVCTERRPKVRSRSCQHMRRGPRHFPQHSESRSRIWQTSDLQSDVDYTNNQATWYIEVFVSRPFVFLTLIIHYYYN